MQRTWLVFKDGKYDLIKSKKRPKNKGKVCFKVGDAIRFTNIERKSRKETTTLGVVVSMTLMNDNTHVGIGYKSASGDLGYTNAKDGTRIFWFNSIVAYFISMSFHKYDWS